jgi:hypothetical protein
MPQTAIADQMIRRLRRWLVPVRPAEEHTAFVRACLPRNLDGAADVARWLALVGGPAALASPRNPFKLNLPALAYAIERRGERPPPSLRAILGFTELVEPMRADRYLAIVDQIGGLMAQAGIAGVLGGDAAAAHRAYPKVEARHIAGLRIIVPAGDISRLLEICAGEGFLQQRVLPEGIELRAESGARIVASSQLFPSCRDQLLDELLIGHQGGLLILPAALLFVSSCIAGYPPIDAQHAPAMIDAALLAPLLDAQDWGTVAGLMRPARRGPLLPALRYLRDALGVPIPLNV